MNKSQSNKMSMYNTVINYVKENQTATEVIPVFQGLFTSFEETVANIVKVDAEREAILAGKTLDKNKEKDELISFLIVVMNGMNVYGTITGNNELIEMTDYSKNDLSRGLRENELLEKGYSIFNLAKDLVTELADYGVTEADIEAVKTNADQFSDAMGIKGASGATSKLTTANLKELFSKADSILYNKLDKLAVVINKTNPKFYEGYENARQIYDR